MLQRGPAGLQQAQHGIQHIAFAIGQQLAALRRLQLQFQPQSTCIALLQRPQQLGSGSGALQRLLASVIAFITAPPQHAARQQARVGFQPHARGQWLQ